MFIRIDYGINYWATDPVLGPATLAGLNSYEAADRVRGLSHRDAVNLFAHATAEVLEVLAGKFEALVVTDEARAIAILADLDPAKAAVLIGPCASDYPRLADLPRAAEMIDRRAAGLKWSRQQGKGTLKLAAQSPLGTDGYFRQYAQGCIYWSNAKGHAFAVHGQIAERHAASGGTGGELGFPNKGEGPWGSPLNTKGMYQSFEGGYIFSSDKGTHSMPAEFADGLYHWHGFPISEIEDQNGVRSQHFECGLIRSSKAGTFAVRSEIADLASDGWVPISAEVDVDSRPTARVQRFKRANGRETAVYSSDDTGAFRVTGRRLAFYEELGGPDSWLGLPTARTKGVSVGSDVQAFEHGSVYIRSGHDVIAVPCETSELAGDRLGCPVSEELPIRDGADCIQFFEKGAVVLRGGKRQILVHPDSGAESVPVEIVPVAGAANPAGLREEGVAVPGWKSFPR